MTRISEIRGSTGVSAGAGVDSSAVRLAVSSLGSGAIVSLVIAVAELSEMTEMFYLYANRGQRYTSSY